MKNVLVAGMQTSGISAANLLESKGFNVRVYDDKIELADNYKGRLEEAFKDLFGVVVSPAIPNSHPIICCAKERNIPIMSELDLGAGLLDAEIVMVTGTNGKTTTVDMINKGLSIMGKRSRTMGNIGYPVSQVVLDKIKLDYAVVEASSFQLEYTSHVRPKIAVLLNIAPDHIDRYDGYEQYIDAKKRIFLNQLPTDYAILNHDSRLIREIGKNIKAKPVYVGLKDEVGEFYVKNNYFYRGGEPLISVKEAKVRGEHNRFNLMVAMNVMSILGAKKSDLISLVRDYKLLPHRVEFVSTINGKSYFNDSKGTNIAACKTAIGAVPGRIGLILGGSDKHEEFCEFFDELPDTVSYVAVSGGNENKIYNAAMKMGYQKIGIYESLESALNALSQMEDVDTVLFSPASASFDRYSSYVERGDTFKNMVYALKV